MRHFRELDEESGASAWVKSMIGEQGWDFEPEVMCGDPRTRVDYMVHAGTGREFGIEVKRRIHAESLTMHEAANYMEQAASYARLLDVPVFVGPIISNSRGYHFSGGTNTSALAAFHIFGGRVNVGSLMFFNDTNWSPSCWALMLRGKKIWTSADGWESTLAMVRSNGSSKVREEQKLIPRTYATIKYPEHDEFDGTTARWKEMTVLLESEGEAD
jgi:hypothetical protein